MIEPDYTKTYTSEDMNKEVWITAHIGGELMDELKQISVQLKTPLNDMVISALRDNVRNYSDEGKL